MKVNFNVNFKNYKGDDLMNQNGVVQNVKECVCSCLFNHSEGLSPEDKCKANLLMGKIYDSSEVMEIEDTESIMIKKVCDHYPAGMYGQLVKLLKGE